MKCHAAPKVILLAVGLIAAVAIVFAGGTVLAGDGTYDCLTQPDSTSTAAEPESPPSPRIFTPGQSAPSAAIMRLRIHVLGSNSSGGIWSQAAIDSQLAQVRADFAPHHIYFHVVGIDTIWTDLADELDRFIAPLTVAKLMHPDQTAINVILGTAIAGTQRPFGITFGNSLPAYKCLIGALSGHSTSVLSHEIGHCLGLYHTFDQQNNCEDIPGVNPEDCAICGDLVCDTPWDPQNGDSGIGYLWDHTNITTCEYDGWVSGADPDPANIMAYTRPKCMEHFSDGQSARMLSIIGTANLFQNKQERIAVAYENKSGDTNLEYEGTPYSSVVLDYTGDGKKDLFISMRDNFGSLQKQLQLSQSEVPQFTDRTELDIAEASWPQSGLRGVAAADYDNNGLVDLFAAAESNPRLYHNNNGAFVDTASALGLAALADSSYAGAWGDFDRDGQIDLYVCRGAGGGSDPTATNLTAIRGKLLRNDVRASGSFVDRSDRLGAASNTMGASVAASWADVEGDGDLDLFVGELRDASGSALSRLYINNGAGGLTESFASSLSDSTVENVNSVVWADMNNDAKLDLVLGSESAPPTVYFNNGTGNFRSEDPLSASLDAPTNGVRPVDSDLDGMMDIFAAPRASTDHRRLFWNQLVAGKQALLDQSYSVGFADSTGRVDGVTMADFNGDGDADVYFGRPVDTQDFFYRAKSNGVDHPSAGWVGVRLVAGGGNNGSAIGARVRFIGSNFEQVQVVDGGSGKGGQADNVLICGLGSLSGAVSAEVKWPGGYVQTASLSKGQVTTITDETFPGEPDSVSGVYTALPEGQAEFTFTWDTPYSCDPSRDKVTITDRPRQPSQCQMGTVVLTPSSDNVTHTVLAKTSAAGGGYRHTLTWPLECRPPCSYDFIIESATDSTHKSQMEDAEEISMPVCISQ